MADRLFVSVMGNQGAGKSHTWNTLFGRTVRRGKRSRYLELRPNECVEVFLVSGSFEERNEYAGDILDDQSARIVLCSIQYKREVTKTLDYVKERDFDIYAQWLNPGYPDNEVYFDRLGLADQMLWYHASLAMRSGKINANSRVQEIREFIYGWAINRGLIVPCNGRPNFAGLNDDDDTSAD